MVPAGPDLSRCLRVAWGAPEADVSSGGDWREAARLPVLSPGENSKFGGYRRGLLMPTVKLFWRFMSVFLTYFY